LVRACKRLARAADQYASGAAHYRLAEVHPIRGELTEAEERYRLASEWGHEPQPGLALLRLAAGSTDAAQAAIDRVVAECTDRLRRSRLLPAQVEIALAAGDVEAGRAAADELATIADDCDTAALRAAAGHARGAVLLASGDARAALVVLRQAWQTWRELGAPYQAARVRVQIGLGCRTVGDAEAAVLELDSARRDQPACVGGGGNYPSAPRHRLGCCPEAAPGSGLLASQSGVANSR
jgi:tetratricopeptide (TPR) repeat protein